MDELKPCSLCGQTPEVWVDNALFALLGEDEENTNFRVYCRCGTFTKFYPTREEAIKAWERMMVEHGN